MDPSQIPYGTYINGSTNQYGTYNKYTKYTFFKTLLYLIRIPHGSHTEPI